MKAVAAALVLIAGAAVVLWYGNTLNSWVLGGLIGGLAALLLSIPISLTVFSYLARRHDERLRAEAEEEATLAEAYDYYEVPPRVVRRAYEVDGYAVQPDDEGLDEEDGWYAPQIPLRTQTARNLPVQAAQYPAVRGQAINRLPASQRGAYLPAAKQLPREVQPVQRKDATGRRTTTRRMYYPGVPGYDPTSVQLSRYRSEALRAARQEAVQQDDGDVIEVLPSHAPRRLPPARRTNQHLIEPDERGYARPRTTRQFAQQPQQPVSESRYRARRTVDAVPSQHDMERSLPQEREPHTDYLENNYPQTGPMQLSPQTGHIVRRSHAERRPEVTTEYLNRPVVRRAPYTYDDDDVRRELLQHIEVPITRRSSLFAAEQPRDDSE